MKNASSFLQMFSVSGVGGGAGASLDFHLDTHDIVSKTDYGKHEEAREASQKSGFSSYKDSSDNYHYYQNGSSFASNNDHSESACPNDNTPDKA